jgi:NAD(P)H-quinone oxidoreductase subunit 5
LLHAGIINAGGFLVLRFAPLLELATPSLDLLIIVGGFTALFASVVMLTQNAIKVALAWSTIAQMGFMLLQCGLGAWPAALLHIVAHSLYKAHAFLSSGSVIDIARASWSRSPGGAPHPRRLALAVAGILAVVAGAGTLTGLRISQEPGLFALGAIVLMSLVHLLAQGIDERPIAYVVVRTAAATLGVALLWFAVQAGMAALMAGSLPPPVARADGLAWVAIGIVVAGFAAITIGQSSVLAARGGTAQHDSRGGTAQHDSRGGTAPEWARALHVHALNGLYVNTLANRLVLKLWPAGRA